MGSTNSRKAVRRVFLVLTLALASLPVMGLVAPAANATVICVDTDGHVTPGAACPSADPAAFAVNICVAQPSDDPDGLSGGTAAGPETVYTPLNNTSGTVGVAGNGSSAGVDAWATGFPGTTPQGELEVYAAGTGAGIGSDAVGC